MSPPEPPRPGRRPSVTEIVEPVRGPLVPELVPTVPPPAMPLPPPKELAGPRVKLPSVRHEQRADLIAELAEETRAAKAEADAVRAAKDAEIDRLRLEIATRDKPEKFDAVAYFTRFQVIALKFLLPLAAVAAAVGVTLGIYSKATIEPKVDRAVVKQDAQAKTTTTVEERVLALEKHARAHEAWQRCMNAERDSALQRGTGHNVEGEHEDVEWKEQSRPSIVPRPLWKTTPWLIKEPGCGAEPSPPATPPPVPPP
jgi:hypothetical protein